MAKRIILFSNVVYNPIILLCFLIHREFMFKCEEKDSVKKKEKLNVHLIMHSHDDVGWLKNVDQYYYGTDNHWHPQAGSVKRILDSTITELLKDPKRKFIQVEIAFFELWWLEQSAEKRLQVKNIVKEGRLEFINGGWCMNDEASTHYNAIIDQMTYGLKFIEDNFGSDARPRIAWHIDPFGHSAEQASLFSQMSFDGFFIGRVDLMDKSRRMENKNMELVWRGSKNLQRSSAIFTGITYNLYQAPPGFCFDYYCTDYFGSPVAIPDGPNRITEFIRFCDEQAQFYNSSNIMLTMGGDFLYERAQLWYSNVDKLIKDVNKDGRVNVFYSTPSIYLDALHKANLTWELKTDDFFPYADCPHCYWTGYFTSRPALKGYVRSSNNLLQVCKQLEVLGSPLGKDIPSSDSLRRAMAVAQHHDAVTGTEKQHVAYDYAKRLAVGGTKCQALVGNVLGKFTIKSSGTTPPKIVFCNYLNISSCPATEQSKSFAVTVYNPIGRIVISFVEIPVKSSYIAVFGPTGIPVKSQVLTLSRKTKRLRDKKSNSKYKLVFEVKAPPIGFATYFVNLTRENRRGGAFKSHESIVHETSKEDIVVKNEFVKLQFSKETGRLVSMTDMISKLTTTVDQQFLWYDASEGNLVSGQASGAYIFRPRDSEPNTVSPGNKAKIKIVVGPLVQEVRQVFSTFVSQVVRLYNGQRHAEFEYTIGPIPVNDDHGKEIITRFDTDIKSNSLFYTDANGREMKERKRNYRPTWKLDVIEPVAGNYYPINSRVYIKDSKSQMTILTDRSLGGSSLKDGSIEIMLHRRLLKDDGRGVGEPLNEAGKTGKGLVVRGKLRVTLAPPENSAALHRVLGEEMLLSPIVTFSQNSLTVKQWLSKYYTVRDSLTRELPVNVHLLTLETRNKKILIRLEHQFEIDEDTKLSQPITVSLEGLFKEFDIVDLTETNLSANQLLKDKKPLQWKIKNERKQKHSVKTRNKSYIGQDLTVELHPMQIRTFKATIKYH